jgi:hypothetical protein
MALLVQTRFRYNPEMRLNPNTFQPDPTGKALIDIKTTVLFGKVTPAPLSAPTPYTLKIGKCYCLVLSHIYTDSDRSLEYWQRRGTPNHIPFDLWQRLPPVYKSFTDHPLLTALQVNTPSFLPNRRFSYRPGPECRPLYP